MGAAVQLRTDYSAGDLLKLAQGSKDGGQARRLLALAAILDGKKRKEAASIGAMDRQTLCRCVHRFNKEGPDGLIDRKPPGVPRRLSENQCLEIKELVIKGPDLEKDGVVRWRCVDLQAIIKQKFGVDYHERTIGKLLRHLGFSHISARPQHPQNDPQLIETFKKIYRRGQKVELRSAQRDKA